jgi:hypothetical protein
LRRKQTRKRGNKFCYTLGFWWKSYIMLLQKVVIIFVAIEFTLELHVQCPHCFIHFMPRIMRFLCFRLFIQAVDHCLLSNLCNKFESVLFVVIGCTKDPLYSVKLVRIFHVLYLSCCAMLLDWRGMERGKAMWVTPVICGSSQTWFFRSYLWKKHTIKCIDALVLNENKSLVVWCYLPRSSRCFLITVL